MVTDVGNFLSFFVPLLNVIYSGRQYTGMHNLVRCYCASSYLGQDIGG